MPESLRAALEQALDHEHHAEATYQAAIAAFGPIPPFVEIVEAERRHADALLTLFERHELDPPPNRWRGRVEKPADFTAACRAARTVEETGAALYTRLMADTAPADVQTVFQRLHAESCHDRVSAFAACGEDRTRHLHKT
ncbi:DUF2202 domain-containing protein [Roseospira marina]|uniref:DUF2202 domain-containing protein n=1 Tax=Roseospira marina TaxID=140057 RepID=A0A5M6IFE8_9PROT|nr:DUF2202 domain-containing protein [Roseospira marina]KAA5607001.1 DUF2202 domain-containing protein [Roseospira marina]MBB4312817.1 rubrerythrin [Roseospira marina]MBB5086410.1 rubrerythrin [Roseospira marina]